MADQEQLEVNLKILSPSTGIEGGVHLPNLPASTTVRDLRQRIQDAVPTKPATEHMRLIYRGRVVANDTDTLLDVFGRDNIRECKDQSLHLVLRELHAQPLNTISTPSSTSTSTSASSSPGPRATTAPPNALRPAQGPLPPTASNNPFRPNSQPQLPQPQPHHHHYPRHHVHHHHHHAPRPQQPVNPFGSLPIPPHLQQHLQQHLAQAATQNGTPANAGTPAAQTPQAEENTTTPGDGAQQQQRPPGPRPIAGFGAPNLMTNATRVIRQEGFGPNGERWTVTYNDINMAGRPPQPLLPRPFPHPPGFPVPARPSGLPGSPLTVDDMLPRVRLLLDGARHELENARALLRSPGGQTVSVDTLASLNPPGWRVEQIRRHVLSLSQNLDNVERGLASMLLDPSMAQNRDVLALQQTAHELRGHAQDLHTMLNRFGDENSPSQALSTPQTTSSASTSSSVSTAVPQPALSQTQQQANMNTPQSNIPTELFILSSPQGPVGILFDQQGTYRTAPMVPTMPFQNFTDQFAHNRELIAGIGQRLAHSTTHLQNRLAAVQQQEQQEQQRQQQPVIGGQPAADQAPNQNQNQNQGANPIANPQGENDRMAMIAGHLWLLFKLACFVYIFAGGGGWYRPIMMCIIAIGVYVAQLGIFENQFNLVRHHFEALLPLADRAAHNPNRPGQNANGQDQQRPGANRNVTPEDAARRLLQQHRDERFGWVRESMRTVERSFAIFVASLWPGIGERMVQAQEERVRAERAAEEERQRLEEEEARRQEAEQAEAQQTGDEKKEGPSTQEGEGEGEEPSEPSASNGKGKEKVEVAGDAEGQ